MFHVTLQSAHLYPRKTVINTRKLVRIVTKGPFNILIILTYYTCNIIFAEILGELIL